MNIDSNSSPPRLIDAPDAVRVTEVQHWNDFLFSFKVERPQSLRFRSGEFVMLGLLNEQTGKPILRAYSIASPAWEDTLEFYSIKVQDGALTSKLQHLRPNDQIILKTKPVGTLVHDALAHYDPPPDQSRLYLIATGTGVAPFASLIRDVETYERFDKVILTHTCRQLSDHGYSQNLINLCKSHEFIGEFARDKLIYYPTTTQETSPKMGRITDLIRKQTLFNDLAMPPFNPESDRVMVCGSMALNRDMIMLLEEAGFREGANSDPGDYVIEKAFVG